MTMPNGGWKRASDSWDIAIGFCLVLGIVAAVVILLFREQ